MNLANRVLTQVRPVTKFRIALVWHTFFLSKITLNFKLITMFESKKLALYGHFH